MAGTIDAEAKRRILNRLLRAQGQLAAVVRLVQEDQPCREVVTQLAATSKAINRAGVVLISSAMQECVADQDSAREPDAMQPADFEKLFLMLA